MIEITKTERRALALALASLKDPICTQIVENAKIKVKDVNLKATQQQVIELAERYAEELSVCCLPDFDAILAEVA